MTQTLAVGQWSMGRPFDQRRFWDKVLVGDGCWEREGVRRNGNGYGAFTWNGKTWLAHRAAWTIWSGPIPDGLQVLHHCDNRRCVRPDHLYLGTVADNMRDAVQRQRVRSFGITHCVKGHEFTPENTRYGQGQRICITCARERGRICAAKRRAKRRGAAQP
jgi:hypothetical protein